MRSKTANEANPKPSHLDHCFLNFIPIPIYNSENESLLGSLTGCEILLSNSRRYSKFSGQQKNLSIDASCGAYHTLCVFENGQVYGFGLSKYFFCCHTYTYTHTNIHTHIHTYTHTHTHTHIQTYTNIHTHIHTNIHIQTYTHTHIHTYKHTHKHTNIHKHTHIHTYTHTNIHKHTHIHTYKHTHTHTHKYEGTSGDFKFYQTKKKYF